MSGRRGAWDSKTDAIYWGFSNKMMRHRLNDKLLHTAGYRCMVMSPYMCYRYNVLRKLDICLNVKCQADRHILN